MLLVLDNCEHVIDSAAQLVDTLRRACAKLRVLTTSRELLGVNGEATWRVTSLSVISPDELSRAVGDVAATVLATEAGRLFADRAHLVAPSSDITEGNALATAQVCQRLDSIPLAIELAAACLTTLSVDQIAARLDHRFRLLTGGHRTAMRRQQTLEATIDWSYELLSEAEQGLVRRLSVFAGGWSLEAAEALGADVARDREDVLDLLRRLVAQVNGAGRRAAAERAKHPPLPLPGNDPAVRRTEAAGGRRGRSRTDAASRLVHAPGRASGGRHGRSRSETLVGSPAARARQPTRGARLECLRPQWRTTSAPARGVSRQVLAMAWARARGHRLD